MKLSVSLFGVSEWSMRLPALAGAAGERPVAVIRAVSDTGFGPGMISGGLAGLRSLRLAREAAEAEARASKPPAKAKKAKIAGN